MKRRRQGKEGSVKVEFRIVFFSDTRVELLGSIYMTTKSYDLRLYERLLRPSSWRYWLRPWRLRRLIRYLVRTCPSSCQSMYSESLEWDSPALTRTQDTDSDSPHVRPHHLNLYLTHISRVREREVGEGDEDVSPFVRCFV